MDEETYRFELRNHFMGQMKNSKFQGTSQHYKDVLRNQKSPPDFETVQHQRRHSTRSSGGDADRVLYESNYASQTGGDSYRNTNTPNNEAAYMRQLHGKNKMPALPTSTIQVPPKYLQEPESNGYMYETDSNIGGGGAGSEESSKSQKSSKTVVSKKSSHDLRKIVKSQCKLHEVIDATLKQMSNTETELPSEDMAERRLKEQQQQQQQQQQLQQQKVAQLAQSCKRCTEKLFVRSSQKDVMTEISKGDFLECRSGDTLTISVDDVVNSKVINPMIRKLQRMYLNNLKEEMSLMEDLERLPHKVNEVYKATIFKQKD